MRNSRKTKVELGASAVSEAPFAMRSPLGFMGLLAAVKAHLETRSEGPGRPSAEHWTVRRLVPFRRSTWEQLKLLARKLGRELPVTPSPAHVAATIIEKDLAPADGFIEASSQSKLGARLNLDSSDPKSAA